MGETGADGIVGEEDDEEEGNMLVIQTSNQSKTNQVSQLQKSIEKTEDN